MINIERAREEERIKHNQAACWWKLRAFRFLIKQMGVQACRRNYPLILVVNTS